MLKKAFEFVIALLKLPKEYRHIAFGYIFVPGLLLVVVGEEVMLGPSEAGLSVAPIRSAKYAGGAVQDESGMVIMVDSQQSEFRIPLKKGSAQRVMMSIEASIARQNERKVRLESTGLDVEPPLLGLSDPLILVVDGEPAEEVLLPGKRRNLDSLKIATRSSLSLALWSLVAVMFGFGALFERFLYETGSLAPRPEHR